VEEHLQVWPYFVEPVASLDFEHVSQHRQHPRWYAAYVGHILVGCVSGNAFAFFFKVGQQCNLFRRYACEVDECRHVFNQYCTEVACQAVWCVEVWCMAATQYQAFSFKQAALWIDAKVCCNTVGASKEMYVFKALTAHGYELALVVGRSARLGKPVHVSVPQHIGFAFTHTQYVAFQFFVGVQAYIACIVFVAVYLVIIMVPPPLRSC